MTGTIVAFLRAIGLRVRAGAIAQITALPGIDIDNGALVVDESCLIHPGDLLHEAGHLAVVPPARRAGFHHDVGNDPGEEMSAIAWSWAAALHLQIDPALVFHNDGYRGGSSAILTAFRDKYYFGVPMLDVAGMTIEPGRARRQGLSGAIFPAMRSWLNEA